MRMNDIESFLPKQTLQTGPRSDRGDEQSQVRIVFIQRRRIAPQIQRWRTTFNEGVMHPDGRLSFWKFRAFNRGCGGLQGAQDR